MSKGELVPSEIVVDLLISEIDELNESEVFVIEGFPKNLSKRLII